MTLEQYYWDGTTWLPTAQQNYTATVNTDSNGDYHFENVPTFVEIGGERYLAGYRLKLDALPKDADGKITYGITKQAVTANSKDLKTRIRARTSI